MEFEEVRGFVCVFVCVCVCVFVFARLSRTGNPVSSCERVKNHYIKNRTIQYVRKTVKRFPVHHETKIKHLEVLWVL